MTARETFLALVASRFGCPYVWDAKGPDVFDCSGLVNWGIAAAGGDDFRATDNAGALFLRLPTVAAPQPGDLVFYGSSSHVDHVMVLMPAARVFGACGGDHTTISRELALQRGACVRYRPEVHYRPDFLGYRKLPFA